MDREDIRNELRRLILDTDSTNYKWSDAVLNSRIDLAHDRIATLTKCIEDRITDALVSGTSEYDLPDYFLEMINVYIKDSGSSEWKSIKRTSMEELENDDEGWSQDAGTPTHYYLRRYKIGLYPEPNYSQASSLRIDIFRLPDAMTADDDTPFNDIPFLYAYHESICYEVAKICSMDEANDKKIILFSSEAEKLIREIKYQLASKDDEGRLLNIYESARIAPRRTW